MATKKLTKRRNALKGAKKLNSQKTLKSALSPIPIPYPNVS
ncbi:MAG TPA: hypothetical protein VJN21_11955 [Candidatus Acidoferrales bacterium]|nr:hypothetical protein [Candidatus Acidoferrales bacterium]